MSLFVHDVQGHPQGLLWRLADGHTQRYEFLTNWPHIFPYLIDNYTVDTYPSQVEHIHRILQPTKETYTLDPQALRTGGGKGSIHVHMERDAFTRAKDYLSTLKPDPEKKETEKDRFQTSYTQLARWEIQRYRKVTLDEEIARVLAEQNNLNQEVQKLHTTLITMNDNSLRAQEEQAHQAYDKEGLAGIIEMFEHTYETPSRHPIRQAERTSARARLEQLATIRLQDEQLFGRTEHERIALGIMSKSAYLALENASAILARKLINNPTRAPDTYTQELATIIAQRRSALNELTSNMNGTIDYDSQRLVFRAHLPLLRREEGRLRIRGIALQDEQGQPVLMSSQELLSLSKSYYDIEKPQFDTPFEEISWCATLVEQKPNSANTDHSVPQTATEHSVPTPSESSVPTPSESSVPTPSESRVPPPSTLRVLDTLRSLPENVVDSYDVDEHRYEYQLVKNVAQNVQDTYLQFIYNASYEASQTRQEGSFTQQGKRPRKIATVDKEAGMTKDFMGRWTMSDFAEIVDWMKYSRIAKIHRPTHRLEAYMNHQAQRAGLGLVFTKTSNYDELRAQDQWGAILGLPAFKGHKHEALARKMAMQAAQYTCSDVEIMLENMRLQPTKDDFFDIVDTSHTFDISISQVMSNANTTRQVHDRVFFYRHGFHNDEGFFRELRREEIATFKTHYSRLKTKTFEESGLQFSHRKGLIEGVDQYYFCPELQVMDSLRHTYPQVAEYVDRTMIIEDSERIVGRLQYLRAFIIPILADHYTLRRRARNGLRETVEALAEKSHSSQQKHDSDDDHEGTEFVHDNTDSVALQHALGALNEYYRVPREARTDFPELIRAASQFARAYEEDGFSSVRGIHGLAQRVISWRNRATFYEKMYATNPQRLEDLILATYEQATRTLNDAGAEVVQAEGKFLYVQGELDQEQARNAGLVRIQEGIQMLSMGAGEFTYNNDGFYKGMSARKAQATAHASLFEVQTQLTLLDNVFDGDVQRVLATLARAAQHTHQLGEPASEMHKELLLKRIRSKGVYKGYQIGEDEEVEFTEQEKHLFDPNYERYQYTYYNKLFGLGKRGVSTRAKLSMIVDALIPLDEKRRGAGSGLVNKTSEELYRELVTSRYEHEQEDIIKELTKEYRRRDYEQTILQGKLF